MIIRLVPRVCESLADQANCAKVVELCGADANLDFCTAKLVGKEVGKAVIDPAPLASINALHGSGRGAYHFVMKHGHDYLHHFANDLVQNIGGDGKMGVVGGFIANALGIQ